MWHNWRHTGKGVQIFGDSHRYRARAFGLWQQQQCLQQHWLESFTRNVTSIERFSDLAI